MMPEGDTWDKFLGFSCSFDNAGIPHFYLHYEKMGKLKVSVERFEEVMDQTIRYNETLLQLTQ